MSRPVKTLWLPGDRDSVLAYDYKQAVKRDGRLTIRELHVVVLVRACRAMRDSIPWARCSKADPCTFCEELAEFCQE